MSRSQDQYDAMTPERFEDAPEPPRHRCERCGRRPTVDNGVYELFRGDAVEWVCEECQAEPECPDCGAFEDECECCDGPDDD